MHIFNNNRIRAEFFYVKDLTNVFSQVATKLVQFEYKRVFTILHHWLLCEVFTILTYVSHQINIKGAKRNSDSYTHYDKRCRKHWAWHWLIEIDVLYLNGGNIEWTNFQIFCQYIISLQQRKKRVHCKCLQGFTGTL